MKPRSKTLAGALILGLGLMLFGCTPAPDETEVPPPPGARLLAATPALNQSFALAGLGLEMRPIPAGSFEMGSPFTEPGRTSLEGPRTQVTLSRPFWLGRTAVTHGQWKAVMGTDLVAQTRLGFPRDKDPTRLLTGTGDDVPMHFVSWHEAQAFCARLNAWARAEASLPEGYEFTLPTEAQWEYACRAGTTEATYAGPMLIAEVNHAPVLDPIAWYAGNSSLGYRGRGWDTSSWAGKHHPGGQAGIRAVGLKQPNAWGLHDMLGNVYEWCQDRATDALPGGSVVDPAGPDSGTDRIVRGGSWHSAAATCRAAYRAANIPDGRMPFIGFRLALAPKRGR